MKVDIDDIQERITECYRPHRDVPKGRFEFPAHDASVGPHIIHLTQALGALGDGFIEGDKGKMIGAIAEIMMVCLFVLSILRQPAGGVLNSKILLMEHGWKTAGGHPR